MAEKGGKTTRTRHQDIHCETVSHRSVCIDKIKTRTVTADMLIWRGEFHRVLPLDKRWATDDCWERERWFLSRMSPLTSRPMQHGQPWNCRHTNNKSNLRRLYLNVLVYMCMGDKEKQTINLRMSWGMNWRVYLVSGRGRGRRKGEKWYNAISI